MIRNAFDDNNNNESIFFNENALMNLTLPNLFNNY